MEKVYGYGKNKLCTAAINFVANDYMKRNGVKREEDAVKIATAGFCQEGSHEFCEKYGNVAKYTKACIDAACSQVPVEGMEAVQRHTSANELLVLRLRSKQSKLDEKSKERLDLLEALFDKEAHV